MSFRANKALGQHFLLNPTTLDKILEKARVSKDDRVLEIGPGPGALTRRLTERAGRVIAVEKDRRFAALLQETLKSHDNLTVLEADFLELDLEKTLGPAGAKWKVVANLPYNIAIEILFRLLEDRSRFTGFYLMVQKEVADRIVARPGSKDYGVLSVLTQLFSENRIVMKLPPGAFSPPPKVDSAVVEFQLAPEARFPVRDPHRFRDVVRAAFSQRRKTIANALKGGLAGATPERISEALRNAGIDPTARAETVDIGRLANLANGLGLG